MENFKRMGRREFSDATPANRPAILKLLKISLIPGFNDMLFV
jgi:hypothetical protein